MPTEITQTDAPDADVTILRVSGELMDNDAAVLTQIASSLRKETGRRIVIDLADLNFLDSEAAPALRCLSEQDGIAIEGVDVFLQSSIDRVERRST